MAWKDELRRVTIGGRQLIGASFRGVPFLVEAEERSGGRATVTKHFPFIDLPHVEDLGRAPNTFSLEAYVLGGDYLTQRDALLAALQDSEGPGLLVHHSYGSLQVICTGVRVRSTQRSGGSASFAIEFAQTDEAPAQPAITPDPAALLDDSATAASEASGIDFAARYDDEEPNWTFIELAEVITAATDALEELLGPAMATEEALADLRTQLGTLSNDAVALARRPVELAAAVAETMLFFDDARLLPRLLRAYDFTPPERPDPEATGTRAKQAVNHDELLALLRRGMAIQGARLAPLYEYDSHEAALEIRDQLAEQLDEQLEVVGDDGFPPLQQLRADLIRSVPGEDSRLERLVEYTPPATVPSLVLAHRLYGPDDVEARELDLVARNHVQHPAYVPGGEPLEVLSGG